MWTVTRTSKNFFAGTGRVGMYKNLCRRGSVYINCGRQRYQPEVVLVGNGRVDSIEQRWRAVLRRAQTAMQHLPLYLTYTSTPPQLLHRRVKNCVIRKIRKKRVLTFDGGKNETFYSLRYRREWETILRATGLRVFWVHQRRGSTGRWGTLANGRAVPCEPVNTAWTRSSARKSNHHRMIINPSNSCLEPSWPCHPPLSLWSWYSQESLGPIITVDEWDFCGKKNRSNYKFHTLPDTTGDSYG